MVGRTTGRLTSPSLPAWSVWLSCMLLMACTDSTDEPAATAGGGSPTGGTGGSGGSGGAGGSHSGGAAGAAPCELTHGGVDTPLYDQSNDRFAFGAFNDWVRLQGGVYDGPAVELFTEADRLGPCRLLTYGGAPYCDPHCDWDHTCDDGTCVPLPLPQSVGTLELNGVGAAPIEITVEGTGLYDWHQQPVAVDQVTNVSLSAPGDVGPAFSLSACVLGPPEPIGDWAQLLEQRQPGEDVVLTWSNPIDTARIYLRMTTGVGTHGGISPVEIECEGRDEGTLTLPGSFLDQLYAGGWACGECGGNDLWRYHATETTVGADTIQLRTQSVANFWYIP